MKDIINKLNIRNIMLILILILIVSFTIWGIAGTHAFYEKNYEILILSGKIGNFASKTSGEGIPEGRAISDLVVQIYLQDQSDDKKYNLVTHMPVFGYELDEELSNCNPDKNTLNYTDYSLKDGKITFSVQDTNGTNGPKQVICHIYYKRSSNANITVYALLEDNEYGIHEHDGKMYRFVESNSNLSALISSNYTYNSATCVNPGTNITGYTDNKFIFTTDNPNTCYVYFNKKI